MRSWDQLIYPQVKLYQINQPGTNRLATTGRPGANKTRHGVRHPYGDSHRIWARFRPSCAISPASPGILKVPGCLHYVAAIDRELAQLSSSPGHDQMILIRDMKYSKGYDGTKFVCSQWRKLAIRAMNLGVPIAHPSVAILSTEN